MGPSGHGQINSNNYTTKKEKDIQENNTWEMWRIIFQMNKIYFLEGSSEHRMYKIFFFQ